MGGESCTIRRSTRYSHGSKLFNDLGQIAPASTKSSEKEAINGLLAAKVSLTGRLGELASA